MFYRFDRLMRMLVFHFVFTMSAMVCAKVQLPPVIGNGMVLQRELPVPVWGWAEPGELVKVVFSGQERSVKANNV